MPTLLCLPISDAHGASARYRAYQYHDAIAGAGWTLRTLTPRPKGSSLTRPLNRYRENREILQAAAQADVIWIQKRLFPEGLIRDLAALGRPIVYDVDDAVFCRPGATSETDGNPRQRRRLHATLAAASLVVAGNSYLADYAARHAARVEILPTVIDASRYTARPAATGPGRVIGWIGSDSTLPYLTSLEAVLTQVHRQLPDTVLRVVGNAAPEMTGIPVEFRDWSEATEVALIREFDVGLMPLVDDVYARGKCACKALQYMAAAVPPVASPVGVNADIIADGVSGRLCREPADWVAAIVALLGDAEVRATMGKRGRQAVLDGYCLDVTAPRLIALFDSLRTKTT